MTAKGEMPVTTYPKVPMHRFAYTALSPQRIGAALDRVAGVGPACTSPRSPVFAGRSLRVVTDGGPTLAYRFADDRRLSLSENGGRATSAGYVALTLGPIAFFAHLLPGTQRGFAVAVDQRTGIATAFEMWFSGYKDNREVSRAVWQGYVAGPGTAPTARHVPTNRIEGKGFHWTQDRGPETLEFYPSATYSHWVELSRAGGEMGYCAPSDYIKIDEELFLYTRTESNFSGIFTVYAADLNRVEQVGLRLGFDDRDALDFYVFRGTGEWLGQIAQFEAFGDTRGGPAPPRPGSAGQPASAAPSGKGARAIYRPLETMTKMTPAEVDAAVAKNTRVFVPPASSSGAAGMARNGTAPSEALAGRAMTLRYDGGPAMQYRFRDAEMLDWRDDEAAPWITARYRAWESMPGAFIFGHLLAGRPKHDGHMVALDLDQGLATCFEGTLNGPYFANEAQARTLFGTVEADGVNPPAHRRHHRTAELVGTAITWNYAPGLTSMHLYSTPETVSWIIFTDTGAGGMEWSGPGDFVKIREGLYFAYWLEEACNGTLGTILINLRTMHDAGIGYHCGSEGLSMSQIGAHARLAGRFDIKRFFDARTARSEA